MPSANEFTPNSVWSSATPDGAEQEVTTPSGQTCRAKRMSIEAMIQAGLLAEADAVTALVSKHIAKPKAKKKGPTPPKNTDLAVDVPSLMKDPRAVTEMVGMVDKVIPHIVVSPTVRLHYSETTVGKTTVTKKLTEEQREEIRQENPDQMIVFTDQIDLGDKMWLFDWAAGGLSTMLAFRQ